MYGWVRMNNFSIIEQLNSKQIEQLFELSQQMWWSKDRTRDDISILLKNSMSFGFVEKESQDLVGFARVLTDEIRYAFIFDVMAVECHRGKGLGKALIDTIIAHPRLKNVKNFELTCSPDMVAFYEKFGFSENYANGVRPMRYTRDLINV